MSRVFLTFNLKTTDQSDLLPVIESLFRDLEDQINAGADIISVSEDFPRLPEGMKSRDIIIDTTRGEVRIGVYNGVEVVYSSFGSFTDAITDTQHGPRAGGSLHEVATTLAAGFMSAADKQKADAFKGDTSAAGPASLTEFPTNGDWGFHTDTVAITYVLARNISGTIKSVALT